MLDRGRVQEVSPALAPLPGEEVLDLAGSVLTLRQALENLIHRFGTPPEDAVRMCTLTPARSIGEGLAGRICPGAPAPLTRWTKDWRMAGIVG